jgi:hypothetical protein
MTVSLNSSAKAVLRFLPNWQQAGEGQISRGNSVAIEFDPERLTGCRRRDWRGADLWDIEALARFHPRGELLHGSLLDRIRTSAMVTALVPKSLELPVPSDAGSAEIWFHLDFPNWWACDAWDSRFGENYWFDIGGPEPLCPWIRFVIETTPTATGPGQRGRPIRHQKKCVSDAAQWGRRSAKIYELRLLSGCG